MARRAEPFVRELTDEEASHLLKQARRGEDVVVRHRAMPLFARELLFTAPGIGEQISGVILLGMIT